MKKDLYADYGKRFVSLVFGLILCGIGSYIVSRAQAIGIGAWETLQVGINLCTGMSYGTACIVVGYGIIVLDILMKGKIGFGSLLNAYLVGATCNYGGLSVLTKITLMLDMLTGRLELYPMLLLFAPSVWRKD